MTPRSSFLVPRSTESTGYRVPSAARPLLIAILLFNASILVGQTRTAGVIDFYGVEKVSREALISALKIVPGDTIPQRPADQAVVTRRLGAIGGVQSARLEPVCCEGDNWILFVGVVERGAPTLRFDRAPTGRIRIADTLRLLNETFFNRLMDGIKAGQSGDDLSEGHSLMSYPPARAIQEEVRSYTAAHQGELRMVLRQSSDGESRAIAAWALGYAADKHTVIPDLVAAVRDPYDEVRNNAVRALAAIGTLAARQPDLGLSVPAEPLLTLLRSPVWTDRNKASLALMTLTDRRDAALLDQVRHQALGPLVEMARWRTGHALAPYLVVARMVGVSDSAALVAFQRGDREAVLRHAMH